VGHPHLYWQESPTARVELVAQKPELIVGERAGAVSFALQPPLQPPPPQEPGIRIVKISPSRLAVVRFGEQHCALGRILKKGLDVPPSGRAMAQRTVDALSSAIAVQSDIPQLFGSSERNVEETDTDSWPQHLPRAGDVAGVGDLTGPISTRRHGHKQRGDFERRG
jgi:hypothetical protein